ncbi:MAG: hypothetical protein A2W00_04860 [Candidatus Eisenbacteria bacterium RBG_16_71_46]|nr:MAG: hypothetical protein A2W00_04860 [Candidatus Eisenbacteria bacterium RBG_16_71_46]
MTLRAPAAFVAAFLCFAPVASHAALSAYTQDFEGLVMADPDALGNDGWLVYGNVFDPTGTTYLYGYGPFPAPNTGAAFCAIATGEGGVPQGTQQLSVYSDYNNGDHALLRRIESNVYQEQIIGAGDVGMTWTFQFDAKRGNLAGGSTALAFIKTLSLPTYALTNFITADMTTIPTTWGTYSVSLPITAGLVGQIFQIGFLNNATNYEPSAIIYDNLNLAGATTDVPGAPLANAIELRAAAPNPFRNSTQIAYSLARGGFADLSVYDIAGRRMATLFRGQAAPGSHVATWDGRSADGHIAPAGVYRYVLQTDAGRQVRSMVLTR